MVSADFTRFYFAGLNLHRLQSGVLPLRDTGYLFKWTFQGLAYQDGAKTLQATVIAFSNSKYQLRDRLHLALA